jgi:PKD repeat protein
VYTSGGTYTVSLTVTGPGGSNTQTRTNYITVSTAAPVASFTASPAPATPPLIVNFSNTSTGTITSYAWTFGDGGTDTAQNPSHVYASPGTYTVSLTVTGPGGSNTQTRTIYIPIPGTAPVATTTVVSSSTNPSTFSSRITVTATVTGVAPTGLVKFTNGGVAISGCDAVVVGGGSNSPTAVCLLSYLSMGDHSLVATYLGDGNNSASTSGVLVQSVVKFAPSTKPRKPPK